MCQHQPVRRHGNWPIPVSFRWVHSLDHSAQARAKDVLIVSLTHLRIAPHHPLFPAILAYQRERVKRLATVEA